jgi:predicted metal-dependent hydrolase
MPHLKRKSDSEGRHANADQKPTDILVKSLKSRWGSCYKSRVVAVKNPAASCGASSIPKEEDNCSRLLTPKQASGNAQTLGFNWKIVMAPLRIIDYVVLHEMCHLKYQDHSPKYWELLGSIIPDFRERKEWLRPKSVRKTLAI